MAVGEGGDVQFLGLFGIGLADGGGPLVHQRGSGRLQQMGLGHGAAVVGADEELEQLPRRVGVLGAGEDGEAVGGGQRHLAHGAAGEGCDADAERRVLQNVLERPRAVFHHGQLLLDEGVARLQVLHVEEAGHEPVVPHAAADPFHGGQRLTFAQQAVRRVGRVDEVAAPPVDMHLDALPGDVDHAAPDAGGARRVRAQGHPLHGFVVVAVGPRAVGIVHPFGVEHVFVVVECQRAVVLGQGVETTVRAEERVVLGFGPIGHRLPGQVGFHIRAKIEQVAALRPDGQNVTAAGHDVGRRAGLKVGHHGLGKVVGIGRVEDADGRMRGMELLQHLLGHAGKPLRAPILVDQLGRFAAVGTRAAGTGHAARAGAQRQSCAHRP